MARFTFNYKGTVKVGPKKRYVDYKGSFKTEGEFLSDATNEFLSNKLLPENLPKSKRDIKKLSTLSVYFSCDITKKK